MRRRLAATAILAIAAGGCFPVRDNENDPSVRPRAAFEVRVAGVAGITASRSADWELDCGPSEDGGHITSCRWFLSDAPGGDQEPGDVAWTPIGEGDVLQAAQSTEFRSALRAVGDFVSTDPSAVPGTGLVRRWVRLVATDDDGIRDAEVRPILVTNAAPSIRLGGDRRVAAGGIPWTGTTPDDTTLFVVTVELAISDPDGDPTSSPVWSVEGDLAARLDLDVDGQIDDAFFADASHAALSFEAPYFPSRGTLGVRIDDVTLPTGEAGGVATDEIEIAVGTQQWLYEEGVAELRRFAQPVEKRDTSGRRLLASDGRHVLRRNVQMTAGGSPCNYEELDHLGRTVLRSWPAVHTTEVEAFTDPFSQQGTSDGSGGWWILGMDDPDGDGTGNPAHGVLCHLTDAAADCVWDPDGDLDPDFPPTHSAVSAFDANSDPWVVAGESAAPRTRLYRMTDAGTVAADVDATAATSSTVVALVAATSGNGVWAFLDGPSTDDRIRHFDAAGSMLSDEALPAACGGGSGGTPQGMTLAPRTGRMFVTLSGGRLCERFPDGSWRSALVPPDGASEAIPTRDGRSVRLLRSDGSSPLRLLTYDVDTFTLQALQTAPSNPSSGGTLAPIGDRGLATVFRNGGAIANFVYLDGDDSSTGAAVPLNLGLSQFEDVVFVTDPATGTLFVWNPASGSLESRLPDGTLARADALGAAAPETVRLTIDPIAHVLWVGWMEGTTGMLERWALGSSAFDAPAITDAVALKNVLREIEVLPGDGARPTRVFVTGQSQAGSSFAFVWDDDAQAASDLPGVGADADLIARDSTGAWILPRVAVPATARHVDAGLAVQTFTSNVCFLHDVVVAPWDDVAVATARFDAQPTPCPDYLVTFAPLVGTTKLSPAPSHGIITTANGGDNPMRRTGSLALDPLHHRFVVGFDTDVNSVTGPNGFVLWVDENHSETDVGDDDLLYPRF